MLPDNFIKRIRTQKHINAEALIKALDEPSPVSIRVNRRKMNKEPLNSDPVPWCNTGYYLKERPSYTFDPLFHAGCYYPQEASGMFLEQVFHQMTGKAENMKVLDLCAAPGGKSTHLSSLIGQNSLLVSNEVIRSRASVLSENISRWGVSNTLVTSSDPSAFSRLSGFFDVVLVDAPCSGEGMFRDIEARKEWSEKNALLCSEIQKRILMEVWSAIKENGLLIYSTCTFNPEENEQNVKWLTEKHKGLTEKFNITGFNGVQEINYRGITGYGFYPDRIKGEGFFLSVIRKSEGTGKHHKNFSGKRTLKAGREDLKIAREWTLFSEDCVIRLGDEICKLNVNADEFAQLSANLRIKVPGTLICSVRNRNYVPSHELALSDGLKKHSFQVIELDYSDAIAYLKREDFKIRTMPQGWFIVTFSGFPLGFAKNLGNRINNYYPINSRIRMKTPLTGAAELIKW